MSINSAVSFTGDNLTFDFINLDVNSILKLYDHNVNRLNTILEMLDIDINTTIQENPYFQHFFEPETFSNFDGIAILQVPKEKFDTLFKVNIRYQDFEDNSLNNLRYAVNPLGWFGGLEDSVEFSESIVTDETAIDPYITTQHQSIKKDFIRHILKNITKTTRLNSLFRNKENLTYEVKLIDDLLNAKIRQIILSIGGKLHAPLDNSVTQSNPAKTLINNILGITNESDLTDNSENEKRKILFLDYIEKKTTEIFDTFKNNHFFVLGTSNAGFGLYYPLRIDTIHPLFKIQYQEIKFSDVFQEQTFYMPIHGNYAIDPSTDPDLSGCVDFNVFDQTYIDIPFHYNDNLAIKITYYPKTTSYLDRPLYPRSYKILLNMSMEMETNIELNDTTLLASIGNDYSQTDISSQDLFLRKGTIETEFDINYYRNSPYNNHNFWLFWNDENERGMESSGKSPYNYYPTLGDISDVIFETRQNNDIIHNWKLQFFIRKFNIDDEDEYGNIFTTLTYNKNFNNNNWKIHNLDNLSWITKYNEINNYENLLDIVTSKNDTNREQQLLGILLTLSDDDLYYNHQIDLRNVEIIFKDKRIIKTVI